MREKALKDITYADVVAFCKEERPESSSLDYKGQYPGANKIATLVSALANTHGGWILIGVPEKKPNKGAGIPDTPTGAEANIASAIQNSCLDAIYPPVLPEFRSIPVPGTALEVLVIRVYESDSTPHEIDGKIYVRTNDTNFQAEDGRTARVSEIEMLLNRREKAERLKSEIIFRAEQRHQRIEQVPRLILSSVPSYPTGVIASYEELVKVLNSLRPLFMFQNSSSYDTAHESICEAYSPEGPRHARFELEVHGLFLHSSTFYEPRNDGSSISIISIPKALLMICNLLKVAESFYGNVDYQGLVDLRVGLRCLPNRVSLDGSKTLIPDASFDVRERQLAHAINTIETASKLCKDFLWSCGYGELGEAEDAAIRRAFDESAKVVFYYQARHT